jgi:hypothetical protein
MALTLIADRIDPGKIYPALAQHQAEPYTQSWREFEQHWPGTVPFRPQEYCEHHGVRLNICWSQRCVASRCILSHWTGVL